MHDSPDTIDTIPVYHRLPNLFNVNMLGGLKDIDSPYSTKGEPGRLLVVHQIPSSSLQVFPVLPFSRQFTQLPVFVLKKILWISPENSFIRRKTSWIQLVFAPEVRVFEVLWPGPVRARKEDPAGGQHLT